MEGFLFFVLPGAFLLLLSGLTARTLEGLVFEAFRTTRVTDYNGRSIAEIDADYSRVYGELTDARNNRQMAERDFETLTKERARLADTERSMKDKEKNLVAEIGFPMPGAVGFYFKFDGPATQMPFAGLASQPGVVGGRRVVRLVVWNYADDEALRRAKIWAGDSATILLGRPFTGKLVWTEA